MGWPWTSVHHHIATPAVSRIIHVQLKSPRKHTGQVQSISQALHMLTHAHLLQPREEFNLRRGRGGGGWPACA